MKTYNVYFIIEKNGHGELKMVAMNADNKKDAFAKVDIVAQEKYKAHAFHKTTECPKFNTYKAINKDFIIKNVEWNGMIYTRVHRIGSRTYLW